jgi:hypothetical protein
MPIINITSDSSKKSIRIDLVAFEKALPSLINQELRHPKASMTTISKSMNMRGLNNSKYSITLMII